MKTEKEEELKTLKDFEDKEFTKWGCDSIDVFKEELKAEAVKWVKSMSNNCLMMHNFWKYNSEEVEGSIKWIKHFFNLTEEDLKEQKQK